MRKWGKILKGFFTLCLLSYPLYTTRAENYHTITVWFAGVGKKMVESTFAAATEFLWEISVVLSAAGLHRNFPFPSRRAVLPTSLHPSCPAALPPGSPVTAESTNWFCHLQMPAATSSAPKFFSFFKWCGAGRHAWAVSVQLCTLTVIYHAEGNLRRSWD